MSSSNSPEICSFLHELPWLALEIIFQHLPDNLLYIYMTECENEYVSAEAERVFIQRGQNETRRLAEERSKLLDEFI